VGWVRKVEEKAGEQGGVRNGEEKLNEKIFKWNSLFSLKISNFP
jgi:hypothetical protein